MTMTRFIVDMLWMGLMVLGPGMVFGQDYPSKPLRIITGTAGGGNDLMARIIAQGITGPLGQAVVIENRFGGVFGEDLAKTPSDGYTMIVQGTGFLTRQLLQKAPYDVVRDFAPISLMVREVGVVVVHPSLPVNSLKDLIVLAKSRAGELNFSTGNIGGAGYLASELFKSMAGINIVHVPYKGTAPAVTAVVSGEVHMTIIDPGLVMPHVKLGKLRALAVTSATPSALVPGLPTVAASGLPGYESVGITGMYATAKTPEAIINRLNREIVRVLNQPDVKERLLNAGEEIVASSPEQFMATIKSEIVKIGKLINDAGIKVN